MLRFEYYTDTSDRLRMLEELYSLSIRNVARISREYLRKRLVRYNTLLVARQESGEIAGFMCSHISEVPTGLKFFKMPLLHFGLSIVDEPFRAQRLARTLPETLISYLARRFTFRFFTVGIILSAKCSSPASYRTIQRATEPTFWPRLAAINGSASSIVCQAFFFRSLVPGIKAELQIEPSDTADLILRGVNDNGEFELAKESYSSAIDSTTHDYFAEVLIPSRSEILSFGIWHPLKHFAKRMVEKWKPASLHPGLKT